MSVYRARLAHNYHELRLCERLRYWLLDRWSMDPERRFFFEGCNAIPGQMYIGDRKALYDTVLRVRPKYCFEIGTYTGGGSTFFLASAFARLGRGKVVTTESDEGLHRDAMAAYQRRLPGLVPFVDFLRADSAEVFGPYLSECGLECVFLDGAEDAQQTLDQFRWFEPHFRKGTVLMAHDWFTDKMRLVKPLLEQEAVWERVMLLTEPDSIGFGVFRFRG